MAERAERELDPKILIGVKDGRVVLTRTLLPASLINFPEEKIEEEVAEFKDRARFRRGMLEELRPSVTITIETPESAYDLIGRLRARNDATQPLVTATKATR